MRNVDRIVKDLQGQVDRKDKQNAQLTDDVSRMRDKVDKLLHTIEELQSSESTNQLSARRAERELREEKEYTLRLQRELEAMKSVRSSGDSGSAPGTRDGSIARKTASWRTGLNGEDDGTSMIDVPQRNSSLDRAPSMTKGFL